MKIIIPIILIATNAVFYFLGYQAYKRKIQYATCTFHTNNLPNLKVIPDDDKYLVRIIDKSKVQFID